MVVPSFDLTHVCQLLDSYRRWIGRDLIERSANSALEAERLFLAPFVVVSHGTQADPIFCFGNAQALQLWELTWEELTNMPSRLTAEPMHRDERAQLLARTTRDGYVDDYRGIRISKSGRRFHIDQAIVWNVLDEQEHYAGQAATFSQWEYL